MEPIKNKKFTEPIIYCKNLNNDTVVIVDKNTTVRYLNKTTLETIGGFKLNIKHTRYKNNIISFTNDGTYIAIRSADRKFSQLYNTKIKKTISKISRHTGEVTCVGVDPKGKYFFSSDEDGKTFVVDIKSAKLSFALPIHKDEIIDIAFSDNSQIVATAGYDKRISIFNISYETPLAILIAHTSAIIKIKFLSQNRLFSIDKSNSGIVWSLETKKVITRISGIHDDVVQVTSSDNLLFLGTKLGFVLVYDLEDYELVSRKFVDMGSNITVLEFDEKANELIVATESGVFAYYYIFEGEDYLKELLEFSSYAEMYEHVDKNPLLKYTKSFTSLLDIWDKTLEKIIDLLQNSKIEDAKDAFLDFSEIPTKNTIMKNILEEYKEFDKFSALVKKGNFSLAYSIVNKFPTYKYSKIYLALEAKWERLYLEAKKLVFKPKGRDKAMEMLAPYRSVADKTQLINDLKKMSEIYIRFINAIGKKDFKILFELIKLNRFLETLPEYNYVIAFGDDMFIKASIAIEKDDMISATKLLNNLLNFSDFAKEAKQMLADIEKK